MIINDAVEIELTEREKEIIGDSVEVLSNLRVSIGRGYKHITLHNDCVDSIHSLVEALTSIRSQSDMIMKNINTYLSNEHLILID